MQKRPPILRIFQTLVDESINILPSLCFEIEKNLFREYLRVFRSFGFFTIRVVKFPELFASKTD